ncbi:hypothetical protein CSUI_004741, partial [Cystoisospora suis]
MHSLLPITAQSQFRSSPSAPNGVAFLAPNHTLPSLEHHKNKRCKASLSKGTRSPRAPNRDGGNTRV